ncbi:HER176Cp [Eremothecium sinecaudum]|uniref:HER176Cp n=1 Tax=Eremothecium sinecaudum TaxID=45286 RepID=A0A0X8HU43_9SACH|nr:HER176Cp [Eremothecium sinecaudum]AMD21455.1 HER176Cp [Eremothecium sinecaudum]
MFRALRNKVQNKNRHSDPVLDAEKFKSNHRIIKPNGRLHSSAQSQLAPRKYDVSSTGQRSVATNDSRYIGDHGVKDTYEELLTSVDLCSRFAKDDSANSKRIGQYYVYDFTVYRGGKNAQDVSDPNFNIFNKPGGVTPTAVRYVAFRLASLFKEQLNAKLTKNNSNDTSMIRSAMEIFKPNLSHYSHSETRETKKILASFFPSDGCSLAGELLEQQIRHHFESDWNRLILALRTLWSYLPMGLIPWDSYLSFKRLEEKHAYPMTAFHTYLPQVLPSSDYTCLAYSFLEILVAIIGKTDLIVETTIQMDLVFTAGQICFARDNKLLRYRNENDSENRHSLSLSRLYYTRGSALHHIFVSYLRSLMDKGKIKDFYLIDNFNLQEYPPGPYKPLNQKALTMTVPKFLADGEMRNDFNRLISFAARATSRIYSSHHTFSKMENYFLEKFEENPLKVIEGTFSKSSLRYLHKFDRNFSTRYFKSLNDKTMWSKALQNLDANNEYAVATWIESCKNHGFNDFLSILEEGSAPDGTLALGSPHLSNLIADSQKEELEDIYPVRLSKMSVSEWFISSWKYEMFLGKIHNTLVIKLTKRVGDCDWLVISTDDRVVKTDHALKTDRRDLPKSIPSGRSSHKSTIQLPTPDTPKSRYNDASSLKHRPPPLNLLGEQSVSPLMSSGPFSIKDHIGSGTTPTSSPRITGDEFSSMYKKYSPKHKFPASHRSASISSTGTQKSRDEESLSEIQASSTAPLRIISRGEAYGTLTNAFPFPKPVPKKGGPTNPSNTSFDRYPHEREISIITEETELDMNKCLTPNPVYHLADAMHFDESEGSPKYFADSSILPEFSTAMSTISSSGNKNTESPLSNNFAELGIQDMQLQHQSRSTPIPDIQDEVYHTPPEEIVEGLTRRGSRDTILVFPKNDQSSKKDEDDVNNVSINGSTDNRRVESNPQSKDSTRVSIESEDFQFIFSKAPCTFRSASTPRNEQTKDFIEEFIAYADPPPKKENDTRPSSTDRPTLFERINHYYQHSAFEDVSKNMYNTSRERAYTLKPISPPTRVPTETTETSKSIAMHPAAITSPIESPRGDASSTSSEDGHHHKFRSVLLKTKRSLCSIKNR